MSIVLLDRPSYRRGVTRRKVCRDTSHPRDVCKGSDHTPGGKVRDPAIQGLGRPSSSWSY